MTARRTDVGHVGRASDNAVSHRCKESCKAIVEMYRAGLSIVRISGEARLSATTIYNCLVAHGVTMRPRGAAAGSLRTPWGTEAVALHRSGETLVAIAARFAVTRERVRQVLVRLGVNTRRPMPHKCNEVCVALLAVPAPVAVMAFCREHRFSFWRTTNAIRRHAIPTSGQLRHLCSERCAALRAGLDAGLSVRAAAIKAGLHPNRLAGIYQRYRTMYHPDWSWPPMQTTSRPGTRGRAVRSGAVATRRPEYRPESREVIGAGGAPIKGDV